MIRFSLIAQLYVTDLIFYLNRDAEDAVHARDGYNYDGYTLRVEFPRGSGPNGPGSRGRGMGGGGRGMGGRGGPPSRRSEYRCLVSGQYHLFHKSAFMSLQPRTP